MNAPPYNPDFFPHWTEIPVRYRDLDPLNHVNNALFCTYFEEARVRFITNLPAFRNSLEKGFSFVLANINIDFIKPVEYPAELLIGNAIKKIGNTSITSFQAIYHKKSKELVSVAESSGVWFDLEKQQPAPLPQKEGISNYMADL